MSAEEQAQEDFQNDRPFEPGHKRNMRAIECAHYGLGVTVYAMQAYVHKYSPEDSQGRCHSCKIKCVDMVVDK